ncbi:MAG: transport protein RbsD/FucU [Micrococcales bacterium]|nr:transport protein RbsD/FucU [Micrococcales bacterium]
MLTGIDPLLTGTLLRYLDGMGHGDTVAVCDAHFPANRLVSAVVEIPGATAVDVVRAIVSVLPLDRPTAATLMDPQGADAPAFALLRDGLPVEPAAIETVGRYEFYAQARQAAVAVRTGETRVFGNALLRKGVVR